LLRIERPRRADERLHPRGTRSLYVPKRVAGPR